MAWESLESEEVPWVLKDTVQAVGDMWVRTSDALWQASSGERNVSERFGLTADLLTRQTNSTEKTPRLLYGFQCQTGEWESSLPLGYIPGLILSTHKYCAHASTKGMLTFR